MIYDECTYEEVKAMRDLQDDPFTEMTGLKKENLIWQYGCEEVYLRIAEQEFKEQLEDFYYIKEKNKINSNKIKKNNKKKLYLKKKKNKLNNMCINECDESNIIFIMPNYYRKKDENGKFYFIKFYRNNKRSSYYKKQSNKKIRSNKYFKYNKGRNCYKEYNYKNKID